MSFAVWMFVAGLGSGFLLELIVIACASFYAVKHPDKFAPMIMRSMRGKKKNNHVIP